jgi:hypothetical protein
VLPVIRDDIDETIRRVHQLSAVDGIHHLLRGGTGEHAFRLGDDGDLEAGQFPLDPPTFLLDRPLHRVAVLPHDLFWGILEGFEPGDKDIGQEEKAARSGVVFVGPSEDFLGDHFAEEGSGQVDGLVVGGEGLFSDELGSVDEETVY